MAGMATLELYRRRVIKVFRPQPVYVEALPTQQDGTALRKFVISARNPKDRRVIENTLREIADGMGIRVVQVDNTHPTSTAVTVASSPGADVPLNQIPPTPSTNWLDFIDRNGEWMAMGAVAVLSIFSEWSANRGSFATVLPMTGRRYTLAQLQSLPTISTGHVDDLKVDNGVERIWLSRVGVDDGMPYDNQVTVQRLMDGRWQIVSTYPAT